MKYSDKLKDPRWQKKRLEIFNRDKFCCVYCGESEKMLSVHHIFYDKPNPWESRNAALVTVCQECHEAESGFIIERSLSKATTHERLFLIMQMHLRVSSYTIEYMMEILMEAGVIYKDFGESLQDGIKRLSVTYDKKIKKNNAETMSILDKHGKD